MKSFLKHKGVISGIFMMVFYQIVMMSIFMWGYSSVPKNMDQLTVAIVNEDTQTGEQLVAQLKENLPFHLVTSLSLDKAKEELNDRDIHLIIHIPQDFTANMTAQGEQAKLDFFMNQSNAQTVTSSMQAVVNQISDQLTAQTQTQGFAQLLQKFQMPEEQAKQTVGSVMNKVVPNIVTTNTVPAGLHNQMAPMFLSMASYVGSMIYSMMSIGALKQLRSKLGAGKAFLHLQGVNLLLALIVPLIGVSIYHAIHGYSAGVFFENWMIHSLEMFAAIEFTSLFCILAGQGGMLINMPLVLVQSIACGATIPREMMPDFFKVLSYVSPMFYSVHLDYNVLFGGGNTSQYLAGLALIAAVAIVVNAVLYGIKALRAKEADQAAVPSMMM
ncbi:hypothetical protein AWM70_11975 [Paenibacillus yonginensis]|uniref:ABC-2 type transporter transmembrane domain-containing protein n=1 Tax=Paenibacillus yonginensis TaxID=1462996 RepID=A0A1B1N1E4_9BACL|nr:ABC transporter permease [Paenibacillus yonginensis]ANS75228.1 hypothetical protein AWM70_11975 [Paenibacillus yonginensis]